MKGIRGSFASRRARILVLALAVICFAVTAGPASAHTKGWSPVHDMYYDALGATQGFHGLLEYQSTTGPAACLYPRRVVLYRGQPGGTRTFVDSTTSYSYSEGATRNWDIFGEAASGTYFAIAKKKVLRRSNRHRHICRARTSNVVAIG